MEALKYLASNAGYSVVSLVNRSESLSEELQAALLAADNTVFFIDNYVEWLDVLPLFGSHQAQSFALVLSARSSSHDVLVERLTKNLKTTEIVEIGLDILQNLDFDRLIDYFDEFGLWGDEATLPRHLKLRHLKSKCEGEWHSILLKLFDSPQIIEKLQTLLRALRSNGIYKETLARLLVLAVLDYKPPIPALVDLCGDKILEMGFRKDTVAEELIEFGRTSVGIRSSVTAEIILKQ